MPGLRTIVLLAATTATGLAAGLFYGYVCSVMPGLARADDRTFVTTMQEINVAILNGWFALSFGGSLVLTIAAAVMHRSADARPVLPWIVAAAVLYALVLVITIAFNVPLNDRLAAAGPVDRIADLAAVRRAFEAPWVRWNLARAIANVASFVCLVWALVLEGRIHD
ncbi:DUF1772 domain-containing protein [Sandaracinus amylolyticus]|uniref:anthrone oxygenase family protein n=1 Tax=Sandaracinus amylolyticus TaxID=927083 RepID=UPI00069D06AD|nr:DUF1772 domain-containing protein [Sandaracinus amylolyticus]